MSIEYGRQKLGELIDDLRDERGFLFEKYGFEVTYEHIGGRYHTDVTVGLSNGYVQLLTDTIEAPPFVSAIGAPFVSLSADRSTDDDAVAASYWSLSELLFAYLDDRSSTEQIGDHATAWLHIEERLDELYPRFTSVSAMAAWMPDFIAWREVGGLVTQPALRRWLTPIHEPNAAAHAAYTTRWDAYLAEYVASGRVREVPSPSDWAAQEIELTKAQFAVVLSRVVGAPFTLDQAARRELQLGRNDITQAEAALEGVGLVGGSALVAAGLADMITRSISPGWKVIVSLGAPEAAPTQLALHLSNRRTVVGEASFVDGRRRLIELADLDAAVEWLAAYTVTVDNRAWRERQPLEMVLPQAEVVTRALLVDTATDDVRESWLWLVSESWLWGADRFTEPSAVVFNRAAFKRWCKRQLQRAYDELNGA